MADVNEERARDLARRWGFSVWHRDYRKILRDSRIDLVSICLPHYMHSKVAVEAAEAGKHILCEKPMALTVKDCEKMIEVCRQ